MGYLTLSRPWLGPRHPPPVLIQAGAHAAKSMRHLGASGLGSATSGEREARPGPATGPYAARSRAPIPCPAPGPHLPPLTGPQGRFFTRSAMFAARRRPRPANQTHPFRPHLHRAVQSESQWRAGAWPRRLEALRAVGLGRACWVSRVRVGSGDRGRGQVLSPASEVQRGTLYSAVLDPWTTG